MKVFAGFLLAIVVIIAGIEAFVFSGADDVSAMARNEFAQGLYPSEEIGHGGETHHH